MYMQCVSCSRDAHSGVNVCTVGATKKGFIVRRRCGLSKAVQPLRQLTRVTGQCKNVGHESRNLVRYANVHLDCEQSAMTGILTAKSNSLISIRAGGVALRF